MKYIILFFFIIIGLNSYGQILIQGIILDSSSKEPLPFVNISVKGTTTGTSSLLSGKFEISVEKLPVKLLFSYVGYRKKEITVSQANYQKIFLSNEGINLNEATVFSGENPALKIMRKVVRNADKNNPENEQSFQYTSYNKMIFTIATDSLSLAKKKNTAKTKDDKEMFEFFEKQHLFLSESVTEKKYYSKNHHKETILASRVSGFASPVLTLIGTQFQSFHFYTSEISLADVKYTGPISQHGLHFYNFYLKDTFLLGKDTVYAISFSPKNEKSLQSLKGILQIHTNGFAVYNVIAEPSKQPETGFGIKISQQYQLIDDTQWFPGELNTELILYNAKVGDFPIIGIGSGKISDVKLNPGFSKKDFDELELSFDRDIENSLSKLEKLRIDSLTNKEKETYKTIDSIGKAHHFDRKMQAFQSVFNGYVPIKFLDWDISKLMNYNDYEKFRLGLALRTNHKISKHFSVGGYFAYGFGDKAWKYGSDLDIMFSKRRQINLNISITQDLEANSTISSFEKQRYLLANGYSSMFQNRFDSLLKYEARFSFRALKHFKFTAFSNYQYRNAFGNYQFVLPLNNEISLLDENYILAETGLELKIAMHEKFIETPFGYFANASKWPVFLLRFTKGLKGIIDSEYEYQRLTFQTNYQHKSLRTGNFHFAVKAGIITGNSPFHLLFNPVGTYKPIEKMTVYSMDGFETMRLNEFLFDQFASFHFRYQLPWPIINGKKFRPMLSFTNSSALGKIKNPELHRNIDFQITDKLYNESGIILDNLLKSGISGFGLGAFYRWGEHQLPSLKENLAIKISLSLVLG